MSKQRIIQLVILIFAIGVLITMVIGLSSQTTAVGIGDEAYNFELEDLEGNVRTLDDFKGKPLFLNFFASWCEPCKVEAPELEKFHEEFKDDAKLLIIVKAETKKAIEKYIAETNSKIEYVFDFNNHVSKNYGIVGQPETIIINKDGIITDHIIGIVSRDFLALKLNELNR